MKTKIIIILCAALVTINLIFTTFNLSKKNTMSVNFLDIGQGDAILIDTPAHAKILIDGGRDNLILEKLGTQLSFLENEIDIVIGTHDDLDHIGGLVSVLERYKVHNLILSLPYSKNEAMKKIVDMANEKDVNIIHITNQKIIETSDGVKIEILFPVSDMSGITNGNDASIVTRIAYGKTSFLLTGDMPHAGELFLVNMYGDKLESDVLKLGHHGSDTSSHPKFLQTVKPKLAIASAGKDNSFGHPHKSVVDLLNKFEIPLLSTLGDGNIKLRSDGLSVWRE
jgi:competence protein ComEC